MTGLEYVALERRPRHEAVVHRIADKRHSATTIPTRPTIESVRIFGDVGVIRGKAKVTVAIDGQSQRPSPSATPTSGCGKTAAGR